VGLDAQECGKVDLPGDFEVMAVQHRGVSTALSTAMAEEHSQFKPRWEDARHGTVVMKDFLTLARFYAGHEAWCYLLTHAALKMPPGSVVESMGKTVAGHGNTKRGLEIEAHAEEAVIHWWVCAPSCHYGNLGVYSCHFGNLAYLFL
jgi:hypothetical protein